MDSEIIIKPNYTLKEYLNFTFKNLFTKWSVKLIVTIALLILVVDVIYLFQTSNLISFSNGIPIFNIIFPILVFIIFPSSIYLMLKKAVQKQKDEKTLFIFNSDYFRIKKELSDVKNPWNLYKSIIETENYFLVKQKKHQTDFFPKRFFSEQQLIDFKELIQKLDLEKKLKS
jgi:hypothetical protein